MGYSMAVICKKCGLPDDLCACGELDKEEARIVVRLETRRFSKKTTLIEGINPKQSDMQRIVKELKSSTLLEIPTKKIGELIMQELAKVDQVAYIRFASVYKDFNDARDFAKFIGKIK